MFTGKTLMVTGGTGSFGHTIVDRFLDTDIGEILVFSRDEKKQDDMRQEYAHPKLRFYLGDVRDAHSLRRAMSNVDFIFHAAALKQVPSCEFHPMEAVATNVMGTQNVLDAAVDAGVSRVVLLSTDKAVYPINAMGMTKAMAEKLLFAKARELGPGTGPILCATRYGNVMGSRGSVIPLFLDQIRSRKPITVTDPTMTRFMMTLQESVDLVLHAFSHGEQGDLFVQRAPACTVLDLAKALSGINSGSAEIRVIGARHGEKRAESLISREEVAKSVDMGSYVRIPLDIRDLNYASVEADYDLETNLAEDYTSDNTTQLSIEDIQSLVFDAGLLEVPDLQAN